MFIRTEDHGDSCESMFEPVSATKHPQVSSFARMQQLRGEGYRLHAYIKRVFLTLSPLEPLNEWHLGAWSTLHMEEVGRNSVGPIHAWQRAQDKMRQERERAFGRRHISLDGRTNVESEQVKHVR